MPYIFTCKAINERFVFNGDNGTGQIGDTIGGIMSPFIAMLAAWLTYLVFKSQTSFQRWQDFDSKFYKMLDVHRRNVSEMYLDPTEQTTLKEIKGVRCFEEMSKELKLIKDLGDYFEEHFKGTIGGVENAKEKLEFEQKAGFYTSQYTHDAQEQLFLDSLFNLHQANIARGVNTYWLSEPLRLAFIQKHNIYAEGGDEAVRYGLGVTYNGTQGVMKQSGNKLLGMNFDLNYRKNDFRFYNKMTFD